MEDAALVALSEIEHHVYCPRQWALISLDGVWSDNRSTAVGHLVHQRVDRFEARSERGRRVVRGLTIWSHRHGLYGRADSVEFAPDEPPFPVEVKSGRRALEPARLQLAAQALCLEEMFGRGVPAGAVWLHARRRRVAVELTEDLKRTALEVADRIRRSRSRPNLPPAVFDARCADCSLIDECLPGLVSDRRRALALYRGLFDPGPGHPGAR